MLSLLHLAVQQIREALEEDRRGWEEKAKKMESQIDETLRQAKNREAALSAEKGSILAGLEMLGKENERLREALKTRTGLSEGPGASYSSLDSCSSVLLLA